jgi:hypothetical protein
VPAALLALLWAGQRRLMYFPDERVAVPSHPATGDLEAVSFTADDGVRLGGWYLPSPGAEFVVLVFNGNAGNRSYRLGLGAALRARGFAVLLFDYRGYGDSDGRPTERGLQADARAARTYLSSRSDVSADRVVYLGESLGAAVAIELALAQPPAALVLRSPFTSMSDVAALHYPLLPANLLLQDRYSSIDRISRITVPTLIVAGDRDGIVPLEQSRRLYDAATTSRKAFVVVPGADHNDAALNEGPLLIEAIARFIAPR